MNPIKVLLVSPLFPPQYSGAGQQAYELGREFVRAGLEVQVLAALAPGLASQGIMDGMAVQRLPYRGHGRAFIADFTLRSSQFLLSRGFNYDVVHFFSIYTYPLPLMFFAKVLGKAVVATTSMLGHDDLYSIRQRKLGFLRLLLLSRIDAFVSQSPPITEVSRRANHYSGRLEEIPYGVNTERFSLPTPETKAELRRELGLTSEALVCVFVGVVSQRKGVDFLLRSWRHVINRVPTAILYLVGPRVLPATQEHEKDFQKELDHFIHVHGLSSSVRFVETTEVDKYYRAGDVFVFPSRQEGLPNAIVEAMSCGLPSLVIAAAWSKGLVLDGIDGYVLPEDEVTYARAVVRLGEDGGCRNRMGQSARQKVAEQFSLHKRALDYIHLYHDILASNGTGRST